MSIYWLLQSLKGAPLIKLRLNAVYRLFLPLWQSLQLRFVHVTTRCTKQTQISTSRFPTTDRPPAHASRSLSAVNHVRLATHKALGKFPHREKVEPTTQSGCCTTTAGRAAEFPRGFVDSAKPDNETFLRDIISVSCRDTGDE